MKKFTFSERAEESNMELKYFVSKKDKKTFLNFRRNLYKGDGSYVCTDTFVLTDILFGATRFAKSCTVRPVAVTENSKTLAQAILIHSPRLPYVQIGFFDALEGQDQAVELIKNAALAAKEELGASGVIVGLNGHISCGVGILTDGFQYKNSFDSLYNKSYYKDYFGGLPTEGLSTYKCALSDAEQHLPKRISKKITVRKCSLKNYESEMALMRELCEKTIANTNLYFQTDEGHFYELTRDLKPFLSEDDLLFALDGRGKAIGFLFSHPDFNQMLSGGKNYSLPEIGLAFLLNKKHIDTVKLNALGSLDVRATLSLLTEFAKLRRERFKYVETNFIWDCNQRSSAVAHKLIGGAHRKYEVYYL